jgi:hypothetical protein
MMQLKSFSGRQWILLVVGVVIIGTVVFGLRAGYLPEIGKFFAYDPGYVPVCGWHGEPISPAVSQCCAAFVQVPVSIGKGTPTPYVTPILNDNSASSTSADIAMTSTPMPSLPPRSPLPPVYYPDYCVMPGCTAVARQVQCFRAPCEPVVEIVCPSGVVPPPRPSYTPTPTSSTPITVTNPSEGSSVLLGSTVRISWEMNNSDRVAPEKVHIILLDDRAYNYVIALDADNTGQYVWDTNLLLARLNEDGAVALADVFGDQLTIQVAGTGQFSNVWGRTRFTLVRNNPSPTVTSTPGAPVTLGLNAASLGNTTPALAGQQISVPASIMTGGRVVTAIKFIATISGPATFVGGTYGSVHFPEVLGQTVVQDKRIEFALGSGTGGGWATGEDIGQLNVAVDANATPGQLIIVTVDPESQVSASGEPNSVLNNRIKALYEVVSSPPSHPGDADGDGDVDIFDYSLVVTNFGRSGKSIPGDVDHNGTVDIFDYSLVVTNFGK